MKRPRRAKKPFDPATLSKPLKKLYELGMKLGRAGKPLPDLKRLLRHPKGAKGPVPESTTPRGLEGQEGQQDLAAQALSPVAGEE